MTFFIIIIMYLMSSNEKNIQFNSLILLLKQERQLGLQKYILITYY